MNIRGFSSGLLALCAILAGCATVGVGTPDDLLSTLTSRAERFGERPQIIGPSELFSLSEAQEQSFLEYFEDPVRRNLAAHKRVSRYLDTVTEDFDFHSATRTASQALQTSAGNCLTLAILTTAFADLAGVEVAYEKVHSTPVFERTGNVVSKGLHVRSILYDPAWTSSPDGVMFLMRPGVRVDYFPDGSERFAGSLSYSDYIAMYYSNVAGEALADGDLNTAFWFALESLAISPDNVAALNTTAVVYRQAGDEATAEAIYRYGIDKMPRAVSFLRNYRWLLKRQGRTAEAEAIDSRLAVLDDPNPFDWIVAARQAYLGNDYREAIDYYRRAARQAPYLHEAYYGMALVYMKLGDMHRAAIELERAVENSQRRATRSRYEAELAALSSRHTGGELSQPTLPAGTVREQEAN